MIEYLEKSEIQAVLLTALLYGLTTDEIKILESAT